MEGESKPITNQQYKIALVHRTYETYKRISSILPRVFMKNKKNKQTKPQPASFLITNRMKSFP